MQRFEWCRPSLFHQLFTIFVRHADCAFPVCFALMTRKTTGLYDAVMRNVQELQPLSINQSINPRLFQSELKLAISTDTVALKCIFFCSDLSRRSVYY